MTSVLVAGVVFLFTFGGFLFGMWLHRVLPPSHAEAESREIIKVATGLLATLAALVLGLLVASAKSNFDTQEAGYEQLAANILVLDRLLAHSGPGADLARQALKNAATATADSLWPANGLTPKSLDNAAISAAGSAAYAAIQNMAPQNDAQRAVQSQALSMTSELSRTRWLLSEQQDSSSSIPFMLVLIFWLTAIYCSFGLFAPLNRIVIFVMLICTMSNAGAIFLIIDLNQPSSGLIQASGAPVRYAISQLGR